MKKTVCQPVLPAELGHLALDPDGRQPLQPGGDALVEPGDGVDLAIAVDERLDLHQAGRLHLAQPVGLDHVDEPAHVVGVQEEGRALDAQDRLADVGVDSGERLDRERRGDAGVGLELGAEAVVAQLLHAAVRVVDQHHGARAEQPLRDCESTG